MNFLNKRGINLENEQHVFFLRQMKGHFRSNNRV